VDINEESMLELSLRRFMKKLEDPGAGGAQAVN